MCPCSSPLGPLQDVPVFLSTWSSAKCAPVLVHLVQCKMCPCSRPLGPVQDVPLFLSTWSSAKPKCAPVLVHKVQCKMCPCSCPLGPVQDVPMFLSTHDHSAQFTLCRVYLPTEQAEKYLKIYVLICHLSYICPILFACKANIIFEETATFKL